VRNDGTSDDMKFLRRIPTREYWEFGSNDLELISKKEVQLRLRLTNIAFILSLKLLYQQGYIVIRGLIWEVDWTDMLKWLRNPEYYHIDKKSNSKNFIRISEYEAYKSKSSVIKLICNLPLKYIYHIYKKNITVNYTDLNDNCEIVR
jgi:hypothetical protein